MLLGGQGGGFSHSVVEMVELVEVVEVVEVGSGPGRLGKPCMDRWNSCCWLADMTFRQKGKFLTFQWYVPARIYMILSRVGEAQHLFTW